MIEKNWHFENRWGRGAALYRKAEHSKILVLNIELLLICCIADMGPQTPFPMAVTLAESVRK
jgi:hypothetical protein